MSIVTENISKYVKGKGFNLSKVSRETGISYQALHSSLYDSERNRSLRDDELVKLCIFLDVDPREFAEMEQVKEVV